MKSTEISKKSRRPLARRARRELLGEDANVLQDEVNLEGEIFEEPEEEILEVGEDHREEMDELRKQGYSDNGLDYAYQDEHDQE